MSKELHIDEVRKMLHSAKDRISRERLKIFDRDHLDDDFNREGYAFAYMRAERIGMQAIQQTLEELGWLPTHLETGDELEITRKQMKKWLKTEDMSEPSAEIFGNEFIHALTRCAFRHGWDKPEFNKLTGRIAYLFRDLAYMISIIHCCNVLREYSVESVPLTNPKDLGQTALEITQLMRLVTANYKLPQTPDDAANDKRLRPGKHLRLVSDENEPDPAHPL